MRVSILGVGQMGLVCAGILTDPDRRGGIGGAGGAGEISVTMWGHDQGQLGELAQSRTSKKLSGFRLPERVRVAFRDRDAMIEKGMGADLVVLAIPVQYLRETMVRLGEFVPRGAAIVSVAKGIENGTLLTPLKVIADVLKDDPDGRPRPCAVLSGPTIATELARCLPATMVAASEDEELRGKVQELFTTRWMRIYTSSDVLGVELAGAIKNVIAIAAGILDGLQAGNNAKSALLARGLAEMSRLGCAMGAAAGTFSGITGAGDLATTCFSPEGRNRSLGEAIGRGARLEDVLAHSMHVVEGVATTKSVMDLAQKYRVEMPITKAVHSVLFEGLDPIDAIGQLMTRAGRAE